MAKTKSQKDKEAAFGFLLNDLEEDVAAEEHAAEEPAQEAPVEEVPAKKAPVKAKAGAAKKQEQLEEKKSDPKPAPVTPAAEEPKEPVKVKGKRGRKKKERAEEVEQANYKVPVSLMSDVRKIANLAGLTTTDVVIRALEDYVASHQKQLKMFDDLRNQFQV